MDIVTLALALKKAKGYTDAAIAALPNGLVYRGEVNYYNLLPSNPEVGDCYSVKYKGISGTIPDGSEYAWGNSVGTNTWIKLGPEDELFICTYGTTTYAEITQALSDGKLPVCIYSDRFYKYDLKSPTDRYTFNAHYADTIYTISVPANNTWSAGSTQLEITGNKVTSISSSSTDSQYPSAKCVYDFVGNSKEIYNCTYGTTTYTEISNAILQGKVPICFKNNKLYIYNFSSTLNIHFFVSFEIHSSGRTDTYQRLLRVDLSNTWITDDVQLENQTNKVYSISNNSTDFQYPSAAAVKNFVNEGVPYLTTAPISDNTSGKLKIVVLNSEPATKYNGYLYIITEGSDTYEYSVDNNVLSISNVAPDHISTTGTVMEIS